VNQIIDFDTTVEESEETPEATRDQCFRRERERERERERDFYNENNL
jgi:hypothetical protein